MPESSTDKRPQPIEDAAFRETLAQSRLLSPEQFQRALTQVESLRARGETVRLEEVLLRDGLITPEQARQLSTQARSFRPGALFGRYRLDEEIGRGGMGVVWKAWDLQLKRVVALKLIHPDGPLDPGAIERFHREAELAAKLRHPSIVAVYDVGVCAGQHYYTAEFIPGRNLEERMQQPLPLRLVLGWVRDIAEALHYAHGQGVVHRDVKPGNVTIDDDERAFLMDFGLAKAIDPHTLAIPEGPSLTQSGTLVGTPHYMSPEQARGERQLGPATDQFALGVVLYRLLTQRLPFDSDGVLDLLNAITSEDPVPPRRIDPSIPADVETLCLKALEKDPARRYADLGAMAADLGRCLAGEPILARARSRAGRLLHRVLARPRLAAACVVALAAVAAGVGWAGLAMREQGRSAARHEEERLLLEARMDKSRRVLDVFARWSGLSGALREIEATAYDSQLSPAEVRTRCAESWKAVAEFLAGTPPDAASQAAARALGGWARRLAGNESEGLAEMRAAARLDPDLPYGALTEALHWFAVYTEAAPLPLCLSTRTEVRFEGPPQELPDMQAARAKIEALVAQARGSTLWGRERAEDFAGVLRGLEALRAGDYAAAEASLSRALAAPGLTAFESGIRLARMKVRYLRMDVAGGLEDLATLARARPRQAEIPAYVGELKMVQATRAGAEKRDPRPFHDEAIAAYTEALRLAPRHSLALIRRGTAFTRRGTAEADRGGNGDDWYRRALADFDRALELAPEGAEIHNNRGLVWSKIGYAEFEAGKDARGSLGQAVADYDECLRRAPDLWATLQNRGYTLLTLALAESRAGGDPRRYFDRSVADFGRLIEHDRGQALPWRHRALAWRDRAVWERDQGQDARASLEHAIADCSESAERNPSDAEVYRSRAQSKADLAEVGRTATGGDEAYLAGMAGAIADYGESLAHDPASASTLLFRGQAHRNVARFLDRWGRDPRAEDALAIVDLKAAVERGPAEFEAHRDLALTCEDSGRFEEARDAYARAKADPAFGSPAIQAWLGESLARIAEKLDLPRWTRDAREADLDLRARDYAGGRVLYEKALASVGEDAGADPRTRGALINLRYNLACIYSLLSAGLDAPGATARPTTPTEAARARDTAFEHLRRALELGFDDRQNLRADTDLAPLHDDPRWAEIAGR